MASEIEYLWMHEKGENPFDSYEKVRALVTNGRTEIDQVRHLKSENEYAIKYISLGSGSGSENLNSIKKIRNEIAKLAKLDHPNIIKVHEVYNYANRFYLVMECCRGGTLLDRGKVSESEAAHICAQILSATRYMHRYVVFSRYGITLITLTLSIRDTHTPAKGLFTETVSMLVFIPVASWYGDSLYYKWTTFRVRLLTRIYPSVRLENIIFDKISTGEEVVRVVDFGHARGKNDTVKIRREDFGITASPESVLNGLNAPVAAPADMWSIGFITYTLLVGKMPYSCINYSQSVSETILEASVNLKYKGETWSGVSSGAKSFVKGLLRFLPEKRTDCRRAQRHEWIKKHTKNGYNKRLLVRVCTHIKHNAKTESLFKREALTLIAHHSSSEELAELRHVFSVFDIKGTGVITYKDFERVFKPGGLTPDEIMDLFQAIDWDGNTEIGYSEFLGAALEYYGALEIPRLEDAFIHRMDLDHNGYIDAKHMVALFNCEREDAEQMLAEADFDKDGKVNCDDFVRVFHNGGRGSGDRRGSNGGGRRRSSGGSVGRRGSNGGGRRRSSGGGGGGELRISNGGGRRRSSGGGGNGEIRVSTVDSRRRSSGGGSNDELRVSTVDGRRRSSGSDGLRGSTGSGVEQIHKSNSKKKKKKKRKEDSLP